MYILYWGINMSIKLICCDCNGVLEHIDHDYSKTGCYINEDNKQITNAINEFVFGSKYLIKSWLVNEISYKEINKIIANRYNFCEESLNNILKQSVKNFEWNWDLINLLQKYRGNGIKVVMTTDNFDIFTEIVIPFMKFDTYFDKIYNSSDVGYLKTDNNLQFFTKIADEYRVVPNKILIIDDSKKTLEKAAGLGFRTYLYNMDSYNDFEEWFNANNR
jgi:FMN phosphatase YigB (HAD superfamily)